MGKKSNHQPPKAEPPKAAPTAQKIAATPAKPESSSQPSKSATAPLGSRKSDCCIAFTYVAFCVSLFVMFLANCSHVLPQTLNGAEFAKPVCEALQVLEGPLKPLLESQKEWGDKIFAVDKDFALELVHYVNVLILGPFALFLAFGFFRGYQCVKNIALIHAAVMFYNMVIVDIYAYKALHGPQVNQEALIGLANAKLIASIVYGYFTFFPFVVVKRVWGSAPFSVETCSYRRGYFLGFITFLVQLALFLWMMAAMIGVYEFSVQHTPSVKGSAWRIGSQQNINDRWRWSMDFVFTLKGTPRRRAYPSVVDHGADAWEKSAPHREQMMLYAAEFQGYASEKMKDFGAEAKTFLNNLGERVLEWAQKMQENLKGEESKAEEKDSKATGSKAAEEAAATKAAEEAAAKEAAAKKAAEEAAAKKAAEEAAAKKAAKEAAAKKAAKEAAAKKAAEEAAAKKAAEEAAAKKAAGEAAAKKAAEEAAAKKAAEKAAAKKAAEEAAAKKAAEEAAAKKAAEEAAAKKAAEEAAAKKAAGEAAAKKAAEEAAAKKAAEKAAAKKAAEEAAAKKAAEEAAAKKAAEAAAKKAAKEAAAKKAAEEAAAKKAAEEAAAKKAAEEAAAKKAAEEAAAKKAPPPAQEPVNTPAH